MTKNMIDKIKEDIETEYKKFEGITFPTPQFSPKTEINTNSKINKIIFVLKGILSKITPLKKLYKLLFYIKQLPNIYYTNQVLARDLKATQDTLHRVYMNLETQSKTLKATQDTLHNLYIGLKFQTKLLNDKFLQIDKELNKKKYKPFINTKDTYIQEISYIESVKKTFELMNIPSNENKNEDLFYIAQENIFYNHDIVKEKQKIYLPFIKDKNIKDWLDIGCGRGEFLELLSREDINATGVEINKVEIEILKSRGFKVVNLDANTYLKGVPDNSIGGISALQVIEHLEIDYLKKFLNLAFNKIKPGGLLILETVNPLTNTGLGNFYIDFSHKKPIPHSILVLLLEWIGFKNIKVLFSSPVPEEYQTNYIEKNYQDYAIIAEKPKEKSL